MPWDDRIKRRLKLRDLDILMAVVQAKSMGKAAVRLNMSQPAVSKAVADLEHALGVNLLDRSYQGVEPTPYGLALTKRSAAMFNELRQGVRDIDFLADPTAGELRIGAAEPIAAAIVAPIVDRLTRQYPRMSFQVVRSESPIAGYMPILQRSVELVISRWAGPIPEGYSAETLFHDFIVVVTGPRNPLTRRRKLDLAELLDQPWLLQPPDNYFGSLVAEAFRARGLALPRLTVETVSVNMRNELLATGRFLTAVPGFSLRLPRPHAVLTALPVKLLDTRHPVAIITLKDRELSPLAQMFCERVRALTKPLAKRE